MTPADFRAWHNAMGYTYDTGALACAALAAGVGEWPRPKQPDRDPA